MVNLPGLEKQREVLGVIRTIREELITHLLRLIKQKESSVRIDLKASKKTKSLEGVRFQISDYRSIAMLVGRLAGIKSVAIAKCFSVRDPVVSETTKRELGKFVEKLYRLEFGEPGLITIALDLETDVVREDIMSTSDLIKIALTYEELLREYNSTRKKLGLGRK